MVFLKNPKKRIKKLHRPRLFGPKEGPWKRSEKSFSKKKGVKINPPKRRKTVTRKKKRAVPKGFSSWKTYMAHIRGKRKGGDTKMKKTRKKYKKNPPTHRRRRFLHNPMNLSPKGILNQLTTGAIDASEIVVGKAIARSIPGLLGISTSGTMGLVIQLGGGIAAGFIGNFINPNAGKMMLAAGLAAPIESLIKQMNIPFISSALGEDELVEISAYPQLDGVGDYVEMGAYPGSGDLVGYEEEMVQQ